MATESPVHSKLSRLPAWTLFMHENFIDGPTMSKKNDIRLPVANAIVKAHTTADRLGKLFEIAKPRLGVAYHYHLDDDTVDPFFKGVQSTYKGPVALAQDLTVINVTPQQIVLRQPETDLLHETPKNPDGGKGERSDPNAVYDDLPAKWLTDNIIS